jgi:hypothetical protein
LNGVPTPKRDQGEDVVIGERRLNGVCQINDLLTMLLSWVPVLVLIGALVWFSRNNGMRARGDVPVLL